MKNIIMITSFIFFFQNNVIAQFGDRGMKKTSKINKFSLSTFSFASSLDSVTITTFLEIPYSVLQFVKKENKYIALYQASIGIKDVDGLQRQYSVWKDSLIVDEYFDTKSMIMNRKHFSSFSVSLY